MASDLVERAKELYEPLDAAAATLAPGEPVPRSVMDQIVDAGLYGLMVPKGAGGQELPLADVVDVYEEISRADGSIGTIRGMVLVDMVGDRDLTIRRESASTRWMTDVVWAAAARLGHRDVFLDEVWCLTAPEIYDRFVRRCGWSHDAYVHWLEDVLVAGFQRCSVR